MTQTPQPPAFSVIVPVYNVEEYVAECLDSILGQTCTDFELIAIDDGSTDGSAAILDTYAAKDTRLRVIHEPNGGVAHARNAGIDRARGAYIVHVDADDIVHPQLLEICQYFITTQQAETVSFFHSRILPHKGMPCPLLRLQKLDFRVTGKPLPLLRQRHRYRVSVMSVMTCCKAELTKKHPFLLGCRYDDYPHICTLMGDVGRHVSLRVKLYGYTVRPGSTMTSAFSAEHIGHHARALHAIADSYSAEPRSLAIVSRVIYPEILKQIGNTIFRAKCSEEERTAMLRAFRTLLVELDHRGLLRWRGHKLRRYLAYRRIARKEEQGLHSLIPRLSKVFH